MIVDASVALKWALTEQDSEAAGQLIGRGDLAAPALLHIELGHTLTKLARQRLLSRTDALHAWLDLRQANMLIHDDDALLEPAVELSLALNASLYDCVYLALAEETDDLLVSADEHFIRAVRASSEFSGRILTLAEAAT